MSDNEIIQFYAKESHIDIEIPINCGTCSWSRRRKKQPRRCKRCARNERFTDNYKLDEGYKRKMIKMCVLSSKGAENE